MSDRHYTDDDLVARLFGVGPEDEHLDSCEACSRRWNQIRQRHLLRRSSELEVPVELLAAQRRAILARVEKKPRKSPLRWIPLPVGALLVLVMALVVFKPAPQRQTTDAISDDQALQDVFTVASRMEPAGLKPVESLFEVKK